MSRDSFHFDGNPIEFRDGQSVAAALTDAGQLALRRTAKGDPRGMFCGMGVCQECLVTIDGVPNRRACMTAAAKGLKIVPQIAFPVLEDMPAAQKPDPARILEPDVAIIGGGAGGLSAAIAARQAGASVIVLDERKVAGGQYYKQSASHPPLDAQQREGAALLKRAQESGADVLGSVEIWGAFDGPLFLADSEGAALIVRPKTAIIATGAYERPCMVPGWTLPGVMTTGAAQTLWRSYLTLPGKRIAICGSGPLNAQVALELAEGGADVAMVAEAARAPWRVPWHAFAALMADPGLVIKGLGMMRDLHRRGISLRHQTTLSRVDADGESLRATFKTASDEEIAETVDALCINSGFEPQNEILRLLGAKMTYDPAFGHLRCDRDTKMETSVRNIFAVGDCAGLGGAPAARVEGLIAGRVAAARAGFGDAHDLFSHQRRLARHRRFQASLWKMHDISPRTPDKAARDTIVCRCEEITLGDILDGLETSPGHVGTLKRATRVGMGRCQGRYCGPVATRLVAQTTGKPVDDFSNFAPRVPIKPVSIASILAAQEALDDPD
ncbi:FAD-dependent oxidoreductase [Roseobacter sp. YSTF-M11]|uniref:FAD-dependent oxidoreductase n=1 Tax=Roseobacter insulae TaxID=2859783 RepID=A0A9X1JYQ2_9RHOB|nr:FAD-dependent oxidoreductase [Roseobacter insulae]MBW4708405.1 FAD-dependent oxidoreductase [Roseobacter insulae]